MKERPILFSGAMVRAILAGTKTQTRRIVQRVPGEQQPMTADGIMGARRCPYGVPGDTLWVREGFAPVDAMGRKCSPGDAAFVVLHDGTQVYRDGAVSPGLPEYAQGASDGIKWRPSIHMPRWASRITLGVTGVRVERLHEITEEDARAEGVDPSAEAWSALARDLGLRGDAPTCREGFALLWQSINAKRAPWASNPWVWVVEFRRAA